MAFLSTNIYVLVFICTGLSYAVATVEENNNPNGFPAVSGQFPYFVGFTSPDFDVLKTCGGSVIGPRHILTMASCIPNTEDEVKNFRVISGCVDLQSFDCIRYEVDKVFVHPDRNNGQHEIAILKLTIDIVLDENTQVIELGREKFDVNELNVVSRMGWADGSLDFVEVRTISNEECLKIVNVDEVPEEMFCTEPAIEDWATFGSPVVFGDQQVGVVVIGNNGKVDAHLRIRYYVDFIDSVLDADKIDNAGHTRSVDEL